MMKGEDIPLLLVGVAGVSVGGYLLWKYAWPHGEPCSPEGDTKCVGTTLMTCEDGIWVVTEKNSPQCNGNGPEPPSQLSGHVYDASSLEPLGGVTVWVPGPIITYTDATGHFSFANLRADLSVPVYFRHDSYQRQTIRIDLYPSGNYVLDVYMELQHGCVYGVVVDADGIPLADVSVRSENFGSGQTQARTDEDGYYEMHINGNLASIGSSTDVIIFEKYNYEPLRLPVMLRYGYAVELNAQMEFEIAGIHGQVTALDADYNVYGVAGCVITLNGFETTSDPEGYYAFYVNPGTYTLTCEKPGYSPYSEIITFAGGFNQKPITMYECTSLYGNMFDAAKDLTGGRYCDDVGDCNAGFMCLENYCYWPIAGIKVSIQGKEAYTDSEGYYEIQDLDYGNTTVTFEKDGYTNIQYTFFLPAFGKELNGMMDPGSGWQYI